jgi:hypothetical protein
VGGEILAGSIQMSGSNIELGRVVGTNEIASSSSSSDSTAGKSSTGKSSTDKNKTGKNVEIIVATGDPVICSEVVVAAARKAGKSVRESIG